MAEQRQLYGDSSRNRGREPMTLVEVYRLYSFRRLA